jgi:3-deoxy-manno-octulosonate cytidylyltransferase (CMP-KDO synthetase)
MDAQGYALYFPAPPFLGSRSLCPLPRAIGDSLLRHIGIYGYRAGFIRRYVSWAPSPLEQIEMLEQLRVLWYGEKIHVAVAPKCPAPASIPGRSGARPR